MAHLYAQAMAFDLLPHLLLCLDAIYSPNAHKIVEKVRNFKLKYTITHNMSKASNYLVGNTVQGVELFGKVLFYKLNESCWRILQSASLLIFPTEDAQQTIKVGIRSHSTVAHTMVSTESRATILTADDQIQSETVFTPMSEKLRAKTSDENKLTDSESVNIDT